MPAIHVALLWYRTSFMATQHYHENRFYLRCECFPPLTYSVWFLCNSSNLLKEKENFSSSPHTFDPRTHTSSVVSDIQPLTHTHPSMINFSRDFSSRTFYDFSRRKEKFITRNRSSTTEAFNKMKEKPLPLAFHSALLPRTFLTFVIFSLKSKTPFSLIFFKFFNNCQCFEASRLFLSTFLF